MDAPDRARLTGAEGRRFALVLAVGFAAVGALLRVRVGAAAAAIPWALAAAALLSGVAFPTRLGGVRRAWLAVGVALSRVTTPVFFTLLYFLVVTPTGLLRRTLGRSPLARDADAPSYWVAREPVEPEAARRALERPF